jgi:hypothetical protein
MIGIPIELYPTFPTNANLVLLTESAKFDPNIVAEIKNQLVAGKSVVITSGLLRALQGRGIEDIVELRYTDRKVFAHEYISGFGAGNAADAGGDEKNADILVPGHPISSRMIRGRWSARWPTAKGIRSCSWTGTPRAFFTCGPFPRTSTTSTAMPPVGHNRGIRNFVMRRLPGSLWTGPSQVALFAYDNNTFVVESFLPTETDVKISTTENFTRLRNLVTGEVIDGRVPEQPQGFGRRPQFVENRESFNVHLPPHSYCVFAAEK